jgi:hypothetical protein
MVAAPPDAMPAVLDVTPPEPLMLVEPLTLLEPALGSGTGSPATGPNPQLITAKEPRYDESQRIAYDCPRPLAALS